MSQCFKKFDFHVIERLLINNTQTTPQPPQPPQPPPPQPPPQPKHNNGSHKERSPPENFRVLFLWNGRSQQAHMPSSRTITMPHASG